MTEDVINFFSFAIAPTSYHFKKVIENLEVYVHDCYIKKIVTQIVGVFMVLWIEPKDILPSDNTFIIF